MQTRVDAKLALLYTLLVLQVLIVMIYVISTPPAELIVSTTHSSVSFVESKINEDSKKKYNRKISNYQTIDKEITLKDTKTSKLFELYNFTLCWKNGVNLRKMKDIETPEKCICNQGWHGLDCGQPEVVWRAIMASKQNIKLTQRRIARRIILMFSVNEYNSAIAEIIVEELYNVVDLFVICDFSKSEDNFNHKLSKGLLQREQKKILYIDLVEKSHKPIRVLSKFIWEKISNTVKNLRDDDIYITGESEQILNSRALMFLKIYDGWPQPIGFRLKWLVYGFFWQHPEKTKNTFGACTIGLVQEVYQSNILALQELISDTSTRENVGLVIGDLNHYGGWYCYLCQVPTNILLTLHSKNQFNEIEIEQTLDIPYIEDLISGGIWINGKTNLLRVKKSRDLYFAPEIVLNETWKYDWLVENFYAKLDYY